MMSVGGLIDMAAFHVPARMRAISHSAGPGLREACILAAGNPVEKITEPAFLERVTHGLVEAPGHALGALQPQGLLAHPLLLRHFRPRDLLAFHGETVQ